MGSVHPTLWTMSQASVSLQRKPWARASSASPQVGLGLGAWGSEGHMGLPSQELIVEVQQESCWGQALGGACLGSCPTGLGHLVCKWVQVLRPSSVSSAH